MRTETIVESRETILSLTTSEAAGLAKIGAGLASKKTWWGSSPPNDGEDFDRTIIRVRAATGDDAWAVRVSDAIGVVSIDNLQLIVQPKIPLPHLLYLLSESGDLPRLADSSALLGASDALWDLVAHWFVDSTEQVLRLGLVRDYFEATNTLDTVTGRMELAATVDHFYAGRVAVECTYDEYGNDTPPNRVLLAALREVVNGPSLRAELRRRATRLISRLDDVGPMRPRDLEAQLERRTSHYRAAFLLGRQVLLYIGRTPTEGRDVAWSFLIRTPEMVEAGIRRVLVVRLGADRVTKERKHLVGSTLTFNPDLVFDHGEAVGDVKYKTSTGEWNRSDLYQTIAFAEAFGASRGLVIRFRSEDVDQAPDLIVGSKSIHEVTWPADNWVRPDDAAEAVATAVEAWLMTEQLVATG